MTVIKRQIHKKLSEYIKNTKNINSKFTSLKDESYCIEEMLNKLNTKLGFIVSMLDGDESFDTLNNKNDKDDEDNYEAEIENK